MFHADSEASATLVKVLRTKQWEDADQRTALVAISLDDLLRAGGLKPEHLRKMRASGTQGRGSAYSGGMPAETFITAVS